MLVALLFSVVSVPGYGQFRTINKKGVQQDGGGGDDDLDCYNIDDLLDIHLLFNSNVLNVDGTSLNPLDIEFECDLFAGVTSSLTLLTVYTPIKSFSELDYDLIQIEDFGLNFDKDVIALSAIQTELNLQMPDILYTDCAEPDFSEAQEFKVNLYCFDGTIYKEVNACDMEEFFIADILEGDCSLSIDIMLDICCISSEPNIPLIPEGVYNSFDEFSGDSSAREKESWIPNILLSNSELKITSNHAHNYSTSYRIINLNGLSLLSGKVDLFPEVSLGIDLVGLPAGIYIVVFNDFKGRLVTKKIIKM